MNSLLVKSEKPKLSDSFVEAWLDLTEVVPEQQRWQAADTRQTVVLHKDGTAVLYDEMGNPSAMYSPDGEEMSRY